MRLGVRSHVLRRCSRARAELGINYLSEEQQCNRTENKSDKVAAPVQEQGAEAGERRKIKKEKKEKRTVREKDDKEKMEKRDKEDKKD